MPHSVKETITIGWCDNGVVEGRFTSGIANTIIEAPKLKINIDNTIRVNGNQIARQRQSLFDYWADLSKSEWLLWVDSDIVINQDIVKMLWDVADKKTKPIVTGTYFVSNENEKTLMEPVPSLYMETGDEFQTKIVHPLPENQVIPVDIAGFGLMLMHRSIIGPVREAANGYSVFGEKQNPGAQFVSEDVAFCRYVKKAGIQLYAHTGAIVPHMKTFSFDKNYYNLYWNGISKGIINKPGRSPAKKEEETTE
jgi:GT2 family glycosyltransferase